MPRYDFLCEFCEFQDEIIGSYDTPRTMNCPNCGSEDTFRKLISVVAFIVKGSNAKNGYYTPPSNEDIGLPPERELRNRLDSEFWKENTQIGRQVNEQEKEVIREHRKKEKDAKKPVEDKVKLFKEKYPELAKKTEEAFQKSKKRTQEVKEASRRKKRLAGDLGTRKATEKEINEVKAKKLSESCKS